MRGAALGCRLEDVAGPPVASRTTPGAATGFTIADGPSSVYSVVDCIDITTDSNYVIVDLGLGTSLHRHRTSGTGVNSLACQLTQPGGSSVPIFVAGVRSGRRAIGSVLNAAKTLGTVEVAGAAPVNSTALTPGTNVWDRLSLGAATAGTVPLFGAAYGVAHSASTRRRVLGWLSRRWGTPPQLKIGAPRHWLAVA